MSALTHRKLYHWVLRSLPISVCPCLARSGHYQAAAGRRSSSVASSSGARTLSYTVLGPSVLGLRWAPAVLCGEFIWA